VLRVEVEFLHRHAPCPRTFHGTMAR
jgi:hypothetical protein